MFIKLKEERLLDNGQPFYIFLKIIYKCNEKYTLNKLFESNRFV